MTKRVLQLTDLHLFSDADGRLNGVPTRACLRDVLADLAGQATSFDAVVVSGDLAQDEQLATYQVVREMLGQFAVPCDVLPGNHDNRTFIHQTFPEITGTNGDRVTSARSVGAWRLLGLDSRIPDRVPGRLGPEQLQWLRDLLESSQEPTLLFVHHPPFAVGSEWIDRLGLEDAAELMALVDAHPCVRGISAGHVHQTFEGQRGALRLMTTPSTAFQFEPSMATPTYHAVPPGYRVFELGEDTFSTEVIRLADLKYPPASLHD